MSTLLLRLAAPMQSWGIDSKFERRTTERAPTKSGVLGLVACALGLPRNTDLSQLQELSFGVRTDSAGVLLRDYHTAKSEKTAYVTTRFYLSDAVFLAGLEGDEALLRKIDYALSHPAFPIFLGRRSCPPEGRVSLGIRPGVPLNTALRQEPWLLSGGHQRSSYVMPAALPVLIDEKGQEQGNFFLRDVPLSFDQTHRKFGFRKVKSTSVVLDTLEKSQSQQTETATTHDAMAQL